MKSSLLAKLRTPCGRTIGHGDSCAKGWECTACADKAMAADRIEELETELATARRATSPAPSTSSEDDLVRRALELYAESYDRMGRTGTDSVSTVNVAHDIRQNMVESVCSVLAARSQSGDAGKDSQRLSTFIDWYLRGGSRSEIHSRGHVTQTTREVVLKGLDAMAAATPGVVCGGEA